MGTKAIGTTRNWAKLKAKQVAHFGLTRSIPYAALRTRAHSGDPITVLVYHTLGPADETFDAWTVVDIASFREQITYLNVAYNITSLDDVISGQSSDDPRPRLVLTFDDGDVGLHTFLLPIVDEFNIPVTVYLATEQIVSGRPFWFDRIMNALPSQSPMQVDLRAEGLQVWTIGQQSGVENWMVISDLLESLKSLEPEQRADLTDKIIEKTSDVAQPEFTPLAPLSIAQVRELAANPLVTLGSHTHCHSLLDQISIEAAWESIETSRELIELWSGHSVRHFAYPNGNHTPALARAVEKIGFCSATVLEEKIWPGEGSYFELPRVSVGRYDSLNRLKLRLVGI